MVSQQQRLDGLRQALALVQAAMAELKDPTKAWDLVSQAVDLAQIHWQRMFKPGSWITWTNQTFPRSDQLACLAEDIAETIQLAERNP